MKVDFSKLHKEFRRIDFAKPDCIDDVTTFCSIKNTLCSTISNCLTTEGLSRDEVDQYFGNALNLSENVDLSTMSRVEKSIFDMIRDAKKMKYVLCYKDRDPDLSEEQQEVFRNCVRELYPRMTEAAQATKERLEMAEKSRSESREEKQEESKKQVRWVDRYPSKGASNSGGITVGSK